MKINNETITSDKLKKSGIYQLKCNDCNKKYTGQTDRPFYIRFQEHFRDFKYGSWNSIAQHLIENKHAIGPMDGIMNIVHIIKKGKMMDTLEKFHI